MTRLAIRVRLTAVFAVAMAVVLAGSGLFVYLRLRADLDEAVRESLAARSAAIATAEDARAPVADPEEVLAQVLGRDGRVVAAGGGATGPALTAGLARRAARERVEVDRRVAGVEGTVRVLARPLAGGRGEVVAVGQSLDDRDETLGGLAAAFAIGGPIAVVLASLLGYWLATAALRPVEAMRRRADAVSLAGGEDVRLPLPAAHDEVRRLGETLNTMLGRLRRSFERERRFVADASHELRTPIAVLKAELDALLRADHPPDEREALVAAAAEADQLARMAEDLLVLARVAEGGLPVRPEMLDARAELEAVRERFADRTDRQIVIDATEGVVLAADPLRLRQALGNLVDNALRHGSGDVTLSARAMGGAVEVEVADGGAGFPEGLRARAFERFVRGDAARTRGGAGLGLAIVRAVAEAHGGRAAIVSGSRVRLTLPSQAHLRDGKHDRGDGLKHHEGART